MPHLLPIAVVAFAVTLPSIASAAQSFRGDYTLSFLGLSVAKASFTSRYQGTSYAIEGNVASAGLARLFDDTRGTLHATGRLAKGQMEPRAFRADYVYGDKQSMVEISFAGNRVSTTKVLPPPNKPGDDWVPIGVRDLVGVADPIAATVIRADSPEKVCGRTVKMYDGEMRANLRLTYASTGSISVPGYEGATVTCQMKFEPVSGYPRGKRGLQFVRDRSRIMVTFAPLGQTGVYALIHATVGTPIGPLTVNARRFEATE
jgi:hypothetical protein